MSDNNTNTTVKDKVFRFLPFFSKLLVVFCVVIAVCMSCGKAEGYSSIEDYVEDFNPGIHYQLGLIDFDYSSVPYVMSFYQTYYGNPQYGLFFSPVNDIDIPGVFGAPPSCYFAPQRYNTLTGYTFRIRFAEQQDTLYTFYYVISFNNNVNIFRINMTNDLFFDGYKYAYGCTFTRLDSASDMSNSVLFYIPDASGSTYANMEYLSNANFSLAYYLPSPYNYTDRTSYFDIHDLEIVEYEPNSGLKISKLPEYDGYTLVVDVKGLLQTSLGLSHYDMSTASLTLTLSYLQSDYSVVIPVRYFDYVTEGNDAPNDVITFARYRIPSTYLDLPDDTTVTISKVDFSITHVYLGGQQVESFKIATSFVLSTSSDSVERPDTPLPTFDPTYVKTVQEITNIVNNLNNSSSNYSDRNGSWDYITDLSDLPSWADMYNMDIWYNSATGNSDMYAKFYNYPKWNNTVVADYYVEMRPNGIVADNYFSEFYDILVIHVYVGESVSSLVFPSFPGTDLGYLVFYSERYFTRQLALTDMDILTVLQNDAANTVSFFVWLKDELDAFNDSTLAALNLSNTLETVSNDWLHSIYDVVRAIDIPEPSPDYSSLLQSILVAIGNISGGSADMSGVEDKLDILINHFLANDSEENSSYLAFVSWLRDAEERPMQYVSDTFDLFKRLFGYFPFDADPDGDGGYSDIIHQGYDFIQYTTGGIGVYGDYSDYFGTFGGSQDSRDLTVFHPAFP